MIIRASNSSAAKYNVQTPIVERAGSLVPMHFKVGRYYQCGRLVALKNGYMLEQQATMIFYPDGTVKGDHHAILRWIRSFDNHILCFDAEHKTIPVVTIESSRDGIIHGFQTSDPSNYEAFGMVPITHRPKRYVYLIASCLKYYRKTVPRLLVQLAAAGILPSQIKVVVNGSDATAYRSVNGIEYVYTPHEAYEFSALYEAPKWDFDYAFLIHDTSTILPGFRAAVEGQNMALDWDVILATTLGRCCLGLFHRNYLLQIKPALAEYHKMSKLEAIRQEVANALIRSARRVLSLGNVSTLAWEHTETPYEGGAARVSRIFRTIHVSKLIHQNHREGSKL